MEIKYKNFTIKPDYGSNLVVVRDVPTAVTLMHHNNGQYADKKIGDLTGETKEELIGYYSELHHAIGSIIKHLMNEKEGVVSLSEWLTAYVKEKEEINRIVKKVLQT